MCVQSALLSVHLPVSRTVNQKWEKEAQEEGNECGSSGMRAGRAGRRELLLLEIIA